MRTNQKKKKGHDRAEIEDSAGADDARQEIADKIQEWKVTKAESKSSFIRRKNQLLDLLEDAIAANHGEIQDSRKLLDEAQERVIEDLSSLAELYLKASDCSALEKTSREIEDIEEEFANIQECFQECSVQPLYEQECTVVVRAVYTGTEQSEQALSE